jgi:hypothetical protein
VTVCPVTWILGSSSYWWPNVPYRSGYRAQLHDLAIHAATDDGHSSDAIYRFGFRESTQNGARWIGRIAPADPPGPRTAFRRATHS